MTKFRKVGSWKCPKCVYEFCDISWIPASTAGRGGTDFLRVTCERCHYAESMKCADAAVE